MRVRHPILQLDEFRLQPDQVVEIGAAVDRVRMRLLIDLANRFGQFERQSRLRKLELAILIKRVFSGLAGRAGAALVLRALPDEISALSNGERHLLDELLIPYRERSPQFTAIMAL